MVVPDDVWYYSDEIYTLDSSGFSTNTYIIRFSQTRELEHNAVSQTAPNFQNVQLQSLRREREFIISLSLHDTPGLMMPPTKAIIRIGTSLDIAILIPIA